jgi:hypothetical protein
VRLSLPLIAFAAGWAASLGLAESFAPGRTYFGEREFIEYQAGDLPIVLTAPHGGRRQPEELPNRTYGVFGIDTNTQEQARRFADELRQRSGGHPHLVISLIARRKLDPNRPIEEAAQGDPGSEQAWRDYHGFVEAALDAAVRRHGFAFLIDLHGHGHRVARLELGYAVETEELNLEDDELEGLHLASRSSLASLHESIQGSFVELLRGSGSIGDLYEQAGIPAVPSPQDPRPGSAPFWSGGYTVRHHTKRASVAGVQIESHFRGVRDTEEARAHFAEVTSDVLESFLRRHYGYYLRPEREVAPASGVLVVE